MSLTATFTAFFTLTCSLLSLMTDCRFQLIGKLFRFITNTDTGKISYVISTVTDNSTNYWCSSSYQLSSKSEVSIMLRCQQRKYEPITLTALQIKNCLKSTSTIKVAIMKNTDDFCYEGKSSVTITIHVLLPH